MLGSLGVLLLIFTWPAFNGYGAIKTASTLGNPTYQAYYTNTAILNTFLSIMSAIAISISLPTFPFGSYFLGGPKLKV